MSTTNTATTNEPEFSKFRRIFFPIHRYELKKAIPLISIFFFSYTTSSFNSIFHLLSLSIFSFRHLFKIFKNVELVQNEYFFPFEEVIVYLK